MGKTWLVKVESDYSEYRVATATLNSSGNKTIVAGGGQPSYFILTWSTQYGTNQQNNIAISLAVVGMSLLYLSELSLVNKVKSGEAVLSCLFLGEPTYLVINPDLVVDYIEGTWIFENDVASNFKVENR